MNDNGFDYNTDDQLFFNNVNFSVSNEKKMWKEKKKKIFNWNEFIGKRNFFFNIQCLQFRIDNIKIR